MDSRLSDLMTYTVFHIGVYLSLLTALIGAGLFASLDHWCIRLAVALFVAAGVAGAIIGSNIPNHASADAFFNAKLGPWGLQLFKYECWARIEHGLFWIGFGFLVVPYLVCGPEAYKQ